MPALRSSRKAGCARRASMALRLGRGGTNTPGYSSWGVGARAGQGRHVGQADWRCMRHRTPRHATMAGW